VRLSIVANQFIFSSSKASEQAKVTQVSYLGMGNPQRTSLYHFGKYVNHTLSYVFGLGLIHTRTLIIAGSRTGAC
jgi:hypothetical protein